MDWASPTCSSCNSTLIWRLPQQPVKHMYWSIRMQLIYCGIWCLSSIASSIASYSQALTLCAVAHGRDFIMALNVYLRVPEVPRTAALLTKLSAPIPESSLGERDFLRIYNIESPCTYCVKIVRLNFLLLYLIFQNCCSQFILALNFNIFYLPCLFLSNTFGVLVKISLAPLSAMEPSCDIEILALSSQEKFLPFWYKWL